MTFALFLAYVFFAMLICTLTALGAFVLTSVRRHMTFALFLTSILCAILIGALATFRALTLALMFGIRCTTDTRNILSNNVN